MTNTKTVHQARTQFAPDDFSHLSVRGSNGFFSIAINRNLWGAHEGSSMTLTKAQWAELAVIAQTIATSDETSDGDGGINNVMLNQDVLDFQAARRNK